MQHLANWKAFDSDVGYFGLRTASGADVAIFRDGCFREKQKDGDGPAEAAPGDAGIVSVGKAHFCITVTPKRLRKSEVCVF